MSLTVDQKYWRKRIFVLTWLAYAGFYFGRKNLSVTWSSMEQDLGLDNSDYASIIFVYSLIYTIGSSEPLGNLLMGTCPILLDPERWLRLGCY